MWFWIGVLARSEIFAMSVYLPPVNIECEARADAALGYGCRISGFICIEQLFLEVPVAYPVHGEAIGIPRKLRIEQPEIDL
jgi:hypothetical protein